MTNRLAASTTDLKEIFNNCAVYWRQRQKEIIRAADEIESNLASRLTAIQREGLVAKRDALGAAVQRLVEQAKSPELVIATTGTTSSGKSTLANFLIGEDILPQAVQEMSAGLVTIRHHDKRHTLEIPSTRGARWEVGKWDDLSANELRARLKDTMEAFREAEREDASIEAVRFEIDWPIRLARQHAKFGLPPDTRVTIVDLPGLKAVSDERNGPVIRENVRQALCLVAYNAEETDDRKQRELLSQIIAQVMALRDSSASVGRMLFLLSRVDAFAKDENPEESLKKFKNNVTRQLHKGLLDRLPEEAAVIEQIEPAAISPRPALWAMEAGRLGLSSDVRRESLEKIETHYAAMFPKNHWKYYPRDFADLTEDQCRNLIQETLRYSKADEFEHCLGGHIAAHLPTIVLTGPLEKATEAANALLQALDQTLDAHAARTAEEAEIAKRDVRQVGNELSGIARDIGDQLKKISAHAKRNKEAKQNKEAGSAHYNLGDPFEELEQSLGKREVMRPAKEFGHRILVEPGHELQTYCDEMLRGKNPAISPLMVSAPGLEKFDHSLQRLKKSPYGAVLDNGSEFRTGAGAEEVKSALAEFAEQLSIMTGFMVSRAAEHNGTSVKIAFQNCADLMLAKLEERGRAILDRELQNFPGLAGLFHGTITIPPFKGTKLKFSPRAENWRKAETREEKEIRYERKFWTLWLVEHKVETPVIVEYEVNGIKVPGLGDLLAASFGSGDMAPLQENFNEYIMDVVEILVGHVSSQIDGVIGGYAKAIDQSVDEADQDRKLKATLIGRDKNAIMKLWVEYRDVFGWEVMMRHEPENSDLDVAFQPVGG